MKKTSYVTSQKEAKDVNKSREYYVDMFADKIIKWGKISPKSIVLDVPCGTGNMAQAIHEKGFGAKFYMVDINPTILDAAREALTSVEAEFIESDAAKIGSIVPPVMNTIMCLNGLHNYIDDQDSFLQGCFAVLQPNGRFVVDVSTMGLNDESHSYLDRHDELIRKRADELGSETNFPPYPDQKTIDNYEQMIIATALNLIDTVYVDAVIPIAKFNKSTVMIPGRLRSRLPQLDDETRIKVFLETSDQAQKETGISEIKHTRVFYIAEK